MPSYRTITLALISQYDAMTIPEFAPPSTPADPFTVSPKLVSPDHACVSVYIPTYPCSQFWLTYSVSPPWPPGLFYYFKLYINGNMITNWGCGEGDGYKGKTMFGLYQAMKGSIKLPDVERRALVFGPPAQGQDCIPDSLDDVMEVKVFRSNGRKSILPILSAAPSVSMGRSNRMKSSVQQSSGGGIEYV